MRIPQQETSATLLPRLLEKPKDGPPPSAPRRQLALFLEGALYTGVGLAFMHASASEQAGVFAIFLAAAALLGPFNDLLTENREAIWDRGEKSSTANRRTVLGVLALFLGMLAAFAIASLVQGEKNAAATFRIALDAAHLNQDTILTRRFGTIGPLFFHNGLVLVSVIALAFIYRSYGALLALTWNAALWAVVFSILIGRAIASTDVSPVVFAAVSLLAVFPHLVLEALAYVTAALAAIYISKGLAKYGSGDPRFRQVSFAAGKLIVAAVVILLVAAAAEQVVAPNVLALIRS